MNKNNHFKDFFKLISYWVLLAALLFLSPSIVNAKLESTYQEGISVKRSLESLRDLDSQTWQVVAYPTEQKEIPLILRIVGYPGSLRLDHPENLLVKSGIKEWVLKDITLNNIQIANDSREAAAEFNLSPLLLDLTQNRPLRLYLGNSINELPVPPYLVKEWRSLQLDELKNE